MDSLDLQVLSQARDWRAQGAAVWLVTVIETWGSAPRPPGALLAMRDDGLVVGSVSGGCVEDDLIDRVRHGERVGAAVAGHLRREQGRSGALRPAVRRQPAPGAGAAARRRAGSTRCSRARRAMSWSRAGSISHTGAVTRGAGRRAARLSSSTARRCARCSARAGGC